jgi:ABC-type multidrug transport system fused ATPase/permease subunit
VLHQGVPVELGHPSDLAASPHGHFRRLLDAEQSTNS